MKRAALVGVFLAWCGQAWAAEQTFRADHVVVTYDGIGEAYAAALGRTAAAARAIAVETFGFDLPDTVNVRVVCGPDQRTRLWTDGQDQFTLTVPSEADLRQPSTTGIFHLYGMCHEMGHLAQYRLVPRHDWMTTAAAEGWAHYLGSRLVDGVYAREGPDLWPDKYDYRADGMARLTKQVAGSRRDEATDGAALWLELAGIVGDKGIAPIFKAWGQIEVDASDPGPALGKALAGSNKNPRLAAWWKKAEPVFVLKREKSGFAPKTLAPKDLSGRPKELAQDDGTPAGKSSLAGGGHAVRFDAPGDGWCLTAVAIYGSRYGAAQAPSENFHVWLCDADFKAIADFPFPYATFEGGNPKWVRLPIRPSLVPAKFIVCVGFNPTAAKGVFVSHDGAGSGASLAGVPGEKGRPFDKGDWLIRVQIDRPKAGAAPK